MDARGNIYKLAEEGDTTEQEQEDAIRFEKAYLGSLDEWADVIASQREKIASEIEDSQIEITNGDSE